MNTQCVRVCVWMCVCAGVWQEMGVARPAKCQLLSPTRLREEDFLSSKLGKLTIGKVPPTTPSSSVLIRSASVNQSYPKQRQQQRHTGAEEWVTKSYQHHQEKIPGAIKCTDSKGPFDCQVDVFAFWRFGPGEVFLENTSWIQWRSCVRPSFLCFRQLDAIPGMASWANLAS